MATIKSIEIKMVILKPKVKRVDAIQSFVEQETPIVQVTDSDGFVGTGYTYTIGTGGASIVKLIEKTLAPSLIGMPSDCIEMCWHKMLFSTHATSVGAITSLAMAAIDIALWDLHCQRSKLPLWKAAGGFKDKVAVYSTEGGWLHLPLQAIIDDALKSQGQGFLGSKIKIGSTISNDKHRLSRLREAVGDEYSIMTDANQSLSLSKSIQYAKALEPINIEWIEEPIAADDVSAHSKLTSLSYIPIAIGESIYSLSQFKDYLHLNACTIVQADVARVGGITPWLKIAHLAESFNVTICPHFLMEIHVSLTCAVANSPWLEYIPQLDEITHSSIEIKQGYAVAPSINGIGIEWDFDKIQKMNSISHVKIS